MLVLKIGGNEIDDPAFVKKLGKTVAAMPEAPVLVHGGGKEIRQLQERLGLEPQYIDGLRVTDAESLSLVKMVLAGRVNKRLTAVLFDAGLDAFGMSGVDRASIKAKKMIHPNGDLGFVGEITDVRAEVFKGLLDDNVAPVLSPICYGPGGDIFNVNADHVAVAIAVALQADELVFISNIPGVMVDKKVQLKLTAKEVNELIEKGIIHSGMIPKVRSALHAIESGVATVRITNLDGLKKGSGTKLKAEG
ncbi:MAG TPA: acetylglutamate kinase [Chloroflexi bacterium]|nr:MAG: acetylglutamate kinase [Anaerolineaceae bacterium 4572_5.2]HEY84266.1 acetylglutamate kinase [Chloroflexota bacterium]